MYYHFYDTFVPSLASSKTEPHCKDLGIHSVITVELVTPTVAALYEKDKMD